MSTNDATARKKIDYRLSNHGLTFSESWVINNEDIQLAARVDENSFGIDHVFQIVHKQGKDTHKYTGGKQGKDTHK